jgi:hypothetical protein
VHIILTCITRTIAHKGHIFRFLWVAFTCRFDCINIQYSWQFLLLMYCPTLWYHKFYDTVYLRAISTNFRPRFFLFNYHGTIGPWIHFPIVHAVFVLVPHPVVPLWIEYIFHSKLLQKKKKSFLLCYVN